MHATGPTGPGCSTPVEQEATWDITSMFRLGGPGRSLDAEARLDRRSRRICAIPALQRALVAAERPGGEPAHEEPEQGQGAEPGQHRTPVGLRRQRLPRGDDGPVDRV